MNPQTLSRDEARGVEALYATGHWLLTQDRSGDASCVFRAMAILAPQDERSWLALGACHEALGQPAVALEMYGTGTVLARPSVRCNVARARVLRAESRAEEAEEALLAAAVLAASQGDPELTALVESEGGAR